MAFIFRYIFILLLANHTFASTPIYELQEVRLAKIELAMGDKDYKEAFRLIKLNLDRSHFHKATYFFLARLHLEKGRYSKAMRVYYYIIKKVHPIDGKKIILEKNIDSLNALLKSISVPSADALEVYLETGKSYFAIADSFGDNKAFQKQLYLHAYKFFRVCERFRFDLASSKYFLGLTNSKLENHQDAIQNFDSAIEELTKQKADKNDIRSLNYLLADSLIRDGHTEAGMIYLKSISLDKKAETSLKQFANLYIRGITVPYFTFKVGIDYNNKTNANYLTKSQIKTLDPSFYGTKSGTSIEKRLDFLFSSKRIGNFSFLSSLRYNDETHNQPELLRLDERVFGGALSIKYDNFEKSLIRLGLDYEQSYGPTNSESGFKRSSVVSQVTFEYIHNLKAGTLSYQFPLELIDLEFESKIRLNKSFILSFTPFWNTIYFSPSYSINYTSVDEGESIDTGSSSFNFTLSNYTTFNRLFSLFAYASFITNSNDNLDFAYNQFDISAFLSYRFEKLNGLSLDFDATQTLKSSKSAEKTNVLETSLGLTYTY